MDTGYYLSDIELAALCKCLNLNVVIFKRDVVSNETVYLRSSVVDVSVAPVLVALQVSPQSDSVRSHFERLTVSGDGSAPQRSDNKVSAGSWLSQ